MEKLKKDTKSLEMKYSKALSQSWDGMDYPTKAILTDRTSSKNIKRMDSVTRRLCNGRKLPRRIDTPQHYGGLDPTAPHLKYGLFPKNKKDNVNRGQSQMLNVKPSSRTANTKRPNASQSSLAPQRRPQIERPPSSRVPTVKKFMLNPLKSQGNQAPGPVLFFRPLDNRNVCSLSLSASTHLDIKPRPLRGPNLPLPTYKRYL